MGSDQGGGPAWGGATSSLNKQKKRKSEAKIQWLIAPASVCARAMVVVSVAGREGSAGSTSTECRSAPG